jgi:hypothetical protein
VQELLAEQRAGVAAQDVHLDRVEAAVGRVAAQAGAIHGEVRGQHRLLDSLGTGMEGVQHRVAGATDRIADVLARMPRRLYYLVCFLVPFLLALALMLLLKAL